MNAVLCWFSPFYLPPPQFGAHEQCQECSRWVFPSQLSHSQNALTEVCQIWYQKLNNTTSAPSREFVTPGMSLSFLDRQMHPPNLYWIQEPGVAALESITSHAYVCSA